ncbi:MAG: FAD-binding oxidoreductase [Actinobacteria bacterium]|nr:MAG: FAD-binding oxidoreductase [Actinomycetota bacterium]
MAISVEGLASAVKGRVVEPGAPDYDESRALYNAMIDKRPAAIAYCVDEADVSAAVGYGREHNLPIAIRSGGHNGGGLGSVDEGLVIDLSEMSEVTVDPAARLARVGGGALLKDVLDATHEHGLTVPVGIIGTTGVGGLTLGGGMGHLTRAGGLTIDNLVAATVVLADGSVVQTDSEREPDLFWALRGGGGNFGVVTSFSFKCHPVTTVLAGPVLYDLEDTTEVLAWYRDFLPALPDEVSGFFAFLSVPPAPPFPEELHLRKVCGVAWTQAGDEESDALREARSFGKPLLDGISPLPLPVWNTAFDALYPPGDQWYWRGEFIREIPDEAIAVHAEYGPAMPTWKSTMHLYPIDGAAARVGHDETAWSYRDAVWGGVFAGVDPDPANAGAIRDWAVAYSDAIKPYGMGGGYVNFHMAEPDRVRGMYGANYDRLARVKAQYDPENVFRVNQNIPPAA